MEGNPWNWTATSENRVYRDKDQRQQAPVQAQDHENCPAETQ